MTMECVYKLFFFFKQKTSYEMRISYWSSDVCSSDLEHVLVATDRALTVDHQVARQDVRAFDRDRHRRRLVAGRHEIARPLLDALAAEHVHAVVNDLSHQLGHVVLGDRRRHAIGRASCRERVCQYV